MNQEYSPTEWPAQNLNKNKITRSLSERFWAKTCIEPNSGCLLWTGAVKSNGYGVILLEEGTRKHVYAHRVAWFLAHGKWPEKSICHKCDTPLCVNIEHFFEGTQADNARDMFKKGRNYGQTRTHCPSAHPYDSVNTLIYQGRRYCRACNKIHGKNRYQRLKLQAEASK